MAGLLTVNKSVSILLCMNCEFMIIGLPVNSDHLKLGPTNLDLLGIIQTLTQTNLGCK